MSPDPTAARDAVLQRFVIACRDDERIRGAFVGGSIATGTADAWSDLDLYLIVADDAYDAFFTDRNAFLDRLGAPVFREDFNGFGVDMLVFILDDGVAGEMMLHSSSAIDAIQSGPFVPIVDRDGLLRDRAFPNGVPGEDEVAGELHVVLTWFWKDLIHFLRAIARGRHWTAFLFVEKLRGGCAYLVTLAQELPSSPPDHFVPPGGYEALDQMTETPEIALLRSTFGPLERAPLLASVRTLIAAYQRLGPPLAGRYGVAYPSRAAEVVLIQLDAVERAATGDASVG